MVILRFKGIELSCYEEADDHENGIGRDHVESEMEAGCNKYGKEDHMKYQKEQQSVIADTCQRTARPLCDRVDDVDDHETSKVDHNALCFFSASQYDIRARQEDGGGKDMKENHGEESDAQASQANEDEYPDDAGKLDLIRNAYDMDITQKEDAQGRQSEKEHERHQEVDAESRTDE